MDGENRPLDDRVAFYVEAARPEKGSGTSRGGFSDGMTALPQCGL
jgi:hypothetical protein